MRGPAYVDSPTDPGSVEVKLKRSSNPTVLDEVKERKGEANPSSSSSPCQICDKIPSTT